MTIRGTIKLDGLTASLDDELGWQVQDDLFRDMLELVYNPDSPTINYSPSNPDPLGDLLKKAAIELGAEIIEDAPPEFVNDQVY